MINCSICIVAHLYSPVPLPFPSDQRRAASCNRVVFVSFDTTSPYFFPRCSTSIERLNDYRYRAPCIYVSAGRIAETLEFFTERTAAIYRGSISSRPSFSSVDPF